MKLTGLDSQQIPRYTFDEENNAVRVVLAGDFGIAEAIKDNLKDIKVDITQQNDPKSIEVRVDNTPGPIQKIEVPGIIKETEIKEIQVPQIVLQKEVEIITIEKPIVVTEYKEIQVPIIVKEKEVQVVYVDKLNYKLLFIFQALTFGLIVLSKFIGK